MSLRRWLSNTRRDVREDGLRGLEDALYEFYVGAWRRAGRVYNYGEPIYDSEWDVLLVLDACRADLMAEVVDDYVFVDGETTTSVASTSGEWMEKNFQPPVDRETVRETAYVSGNPFTDKVFFRWECPNCGTAMTEGGPCETCGSDCDRTRVPDHDFQLLDEVWQYAWSDDLGTIPPDPLTDRAIQTWREKSPGRMIVHYMQPHHPFVGSGIDTRLHPDEFGAAHDSVWDQLRRGEVDEGSVWTGYRANLEYVLDDVVRLLENIDAGRVVITADHGNSIGEWGLYGHYRGVPAPSQKRVPWCVTTAENIRDDDPDVDTEGVGDSDAAGNIEERLEALGYR